MTTSAPAAIRTEIRGRVAWIRFDGTRPFDGAFWTELAAALDRDRDVDCVALHGGPRFSAGNNLAWLSGAVGRATRRGGPESALRAAGAPMRAVGRLLNDSPVVTVAVLAGEIVGAGTELAALTDLRVAAGPVTLALPEPRLGVVPDLAPPALLAAVLGPGLARRLLVAGETVRLEPGHRFVDFWYDDLARAETELGARTADFARGPVLRALRGATARNAALAEAAALNAELVGADEFRSALGRFAEHR
ncbi:enoyl-CoA hydratase/isomerase family protein [Nocardia sp. NPDC050697]|uniref:enoyl-CoA hydratase/isomerase family protein n=1 Tax=Nocardia sp. NPDC050697 TaxID=3155158 RepID=UPI0033DC8051